VKKSGGNLQKGVVANNKGRLQVIGAGYKGSGQMFWGAIMGKMNWDENRGAQKGR